MSTCQSRAVAMEKEPGEWASRKQWHSKVEHEASRAQRASLSQEMVKARLMGVLESHGVSYGGAV